MQLRGSTGYLYSVPLAALLLPFAWAMFFTFPYGDDFARAVLARGLFDWVGGIHDMVRNWLGWSGRYTHHFLVVFLGDTVMTRAGYGALCLGVFSLYGVALFGIFSHVAQGARLRERVFLTLLSLGALATGHQALDVTFYVVTDALGLGIGNAMALMFVYALCRLWHLPLARRRDIAFTVLCGAFAVGCYEHAAIAAFLAAALAFWIAFRSRHPHRRIYLLVAGAMLVFLLVSFLAPGNFNRQRIRDVSEARMLEQLLLAGRDWLAVTPQALYSSFALLAVFLGLTVTPSRRAGLPTLSQVGVAAAGLLVLVSLSAGIVVVHALSDVRVTSNHKLSASLHLLLGVVLAFVAIAGAGKLREFASKVSPVLLVLPLFLVFITSSNTTGTLRSIVTGQLDQYAAAMTQRLAVLGATRNDDIQIAPLQLCPFPACTGEPFPASDSTWPARYVATLYGHRSVVTAAIDPSRAYAAQPDLAWSRIPRSNHEAAYVAIDPGPNASYRDGWLFVRTTQQTAALGLSVVLAEGDARYGKPLRPRLAPVVRPTSSAATAGSAGASTRVFGAPLGLGDPAAVPAIFVSADGTHYHRLSHARQ